MARLGITLNPEDAGQKVPSHDVQIPSGAANEMVPRIGGQFVQQTFEEPTRRLALACPDQRNAAHRLCRHRGDGIFQ